MVLQPAERTAGTCYHDRGGLLPRLFTLTLSKEGGYSLLRYHPLAKIFPLGSAVPSVARTFLSQPCGHQRQSLPAVRSKDS